MKFLILITTVIFSAHTFAENTKEVTKVVGAASTATTPGAGFKLSSMEKGSVYEKLGLKQGDIIKSYNGKPVNSVQESMEMYNQLKTANQAELEIVRDGKIQKLKYNIK